MRFLSILIFLVFCTGFSSFAVGRNLEDEKPVVEVKDNNSLNTMKVAAYIQARMEYGDLAFGDGPTVKDSEFDLYFRRVSIGAYGTAFYPNLKYGFTLLADESAHHEIYPQYSESHGLTLGGTYLQYFYQDSHFVKFGKDKIPLSRVYLTSSTRQMFAERPYYTYAWRDVLRTYALTNLSVGGKVFGNTTNYEFAISKAQRFGNHLHRTEEVQVESASPFYAARLDWSPPGWIEGSRSDAHLGKGKHLNFGVYLAKQADVTYRPTILTGSESRLLYGYDLSFHLKNITFQAEYNRFNIDSNIARLNRESSGWYLQSGYLIAKQMLEPAIRYEEFKFDNRINDSSIRVLTLGVNKYLKEHNLKFSFNFEATKFGENILLLRPEGKSSGKAFRTTLQFIF